MPPGRVTGCHQGVTLFCSDRRQMLCRMSGGRMQTNPPATAYQTGLCGPGLADRLLDDPQDTCSQPLIPVHPQV